MTRLKDAIKAAFKRTAIASIAALGWAFALGPPGIVHAAVADSLTVTLRPHDNYPPSAITDLTATPGAVGQMLLEWTASDSNNFVYLVGRSPASSYVIRIATYSADSVGSTTTWWNTAQDVSGEPAPSNPSEMDSMLLNSLTQGVTYWAAIKSIDDKGLVSAIDGRTVTAGQQANALIAQASPNTPTNLAATALSTSSIQWTWDLSSGATFYQLRDSPTSTLIANTTNLLFIETGLTPNQGVSRTISAGNAAGQSSPSSPVTAYSLADLPTNLTITSVGTTQINLLWNSAGNPAGTQYRLERSLNGVAFTPLSLSTNTTRTDTGLSALTTYYYRLFALNGNSVATGPTAPVSTTTLPTGDILAPSEPMGLKGSLDPTGQAFTLIWEAVTLNTDGTPLTDLAGYLVYRSTALKGVYTRITPVPISLTVFADLVNSQIFYYKVRAADTTGNESADSLFADSSLQANIIFLASDQLSNVRMPTVVNNLLRSAHNKYGTPLTIQMTEDPVPSNTEIVRHVKLRLVRGDTKQAVNDLAFDKPETIVAVGYSLLNGYVQSGSPLGLGTIGSAAANVTPEQLSMYWHNGVTWVRIGGTLDKPTQSVQTRSSFLGDYQLRAVAAATSLTLSQGNVYPRLFTPNGDGFNDRVYFVFENPNNSSVSGEIFDLDGRRVAAIFSGGAGIGTTLIWDGKDSNGAVVPAGAYIYKIRGEGKTFTGTVGVAR